MLILRDSFNKNRKTVLVNSQLKLERSLLPVVWPMCGLCVAYVPHLKDVFDKTFYVLHRYNCCVARTWFWPQAGPALSSVGLELLMVRAERIVFFHGPEREG